MVATADLNESDVVINRNRMKSVRDEDFDAGEEIVPTTCFYLGQCRIIVNLFVMAVLWAVCAFNYYMLGMVALSFTNAFQTSMYGYVADIVASFIVTPIYDCFGAKATYILCFLISTGCGVGILRWGLDHESSTGFLMLYLGARFGTTAAFTANFVATAKLFPVLFTATAFGICNFISRILQGASFVMATLDEPLPMQIFTVSSFFSLICSFCILKPKYKQ